MLQTNKRCKILSAALVAAYIVATIEKPISGPQGPC
jgi:hypothetical protein